MSTRAPAKTRKPRAARPAAAASRRAGAAAKTLRTGRKGSAVVARPQADAAHDAERVIAISGSQSGLGLAIRQRLDAAGVRTIGIDLPGKGADVEADLSRAAGREQAVQGVLERCDGRLDGLVANAGVDAKDAKLTFGVNFHGVVDLLEGLRPALAAGAPSAAVVTVSHAVMVTPGVRSAAADALLDGRDGRAALLAGRTPSAAYAVSKLAVARWIRAHAANAQWAGAGISLNGVCPGAIVTPLLERDLADKLKGPLIRAMPKPLGEIAEPEDLAGIFEFLLSRDARFVVGQLLVSDGGVESQWRQADWPQPWDISLARFLFKLFAQR